MEGTILDRLIPIIKKDYKEKNERKLNPLSFEHEIEEILTESFKSSSGTGGASWCLGSDELERWGKTKDDIVDYLIDQGFKAEIVRGRYIDICSPELRDEMSEFIKKERKKNAF